MNSVIAETMVSGDWIIALLVAVIPLVGAVWIKAKRAGAKEAAMQKVTLQEPVPDLPMRRVYSPPTFSQHMEVVRRVEALETDHAKLRQEVAKQYVELLKVGEERKDKIIEEFNRVADGFHSRVNQLVTELHAAKASTRKS